MEGREKEVFDMAERAKAIVETAERRRSAEVRGNMRCPNYIGSSHGIASWIIVVHDLDEGFDFQLVVNAPS